MRHLRALVVAVCSASVRCPAVAAAAAFIAGIGLHSLAPGRPAVWLAAAAAFALAALLAARRDGLASASLAAALAATGLAAGQLQAYRYPANHVAHFTAEHPRLVQVEVRLDQPPRLLASPGAHPRLPSLRQVGGGQVTRILLQEGWTPATGEVRISIRQPHPRLAIGQTIRLVGLLSRPQPASNPGQFDWWRYYRSQRILAVIEAEAADAVQILHDPPPGLLPRLRQAARHVLAMGFDPRNTLDLALLRALVLGDSDPQLRDVQDQFMRTGTSHHLAISGMHVAVLSFCVYLLCRAMFCPPRPAAWIMMGFVVLYGLVALPSPPVVRSVILCLCFGMGMVLRRHVHGVQLLAVTVLIMLAWQPLDLYNAGFQLSFGTVLGLMVLSRPLLEWLTPTPDDDEEVLRKLGQLTRWQRFRRWSLRFALAALAAGGAAWAVSAPIIARHFGQLNPWAIPASILMGVPVFIALIGGFLKIVLTLLLPSFAPAWAALAALPIAAMRCLVDFLARWPGADLPTPAPPLALIAVFYLLLALPLLYPAVGRWRWALRAGPAMACVGILLLPLWARWAAPGRGELRVTLLSVGAGQCAVVTLPSGRAVLIDAGSSSAPDLCRRTLQPCLRQLGAAKVEAIFLSHANFDHFSAAADAAEAFSVAKVFITPRFVEHSQDDEQARQALTRLGQRGCRIEVLHAGQSLALGEGAEVQVLWPPDDAPLDPNNSSLALRLNYAGRAVLFPGDIQEPAQQQLLAAGTDLRSDVLIAPHHGSWERTTAQVIDAVEPRLVLASSDRRLSRRQRRFDEELAPVTVQRTGARGAIVVSITAEGRMRWRSCR